MRRLLLLLGLLLVPRAAFAGPNTLPYPSQTLLSLNHPNVFMSPQVSSPPIQFQNAGTPIGVSFTFNCSTGTTCSMVGGVMTLTASGGSGTINSCGTTNAIAQYTAATTLGCGNADFTIDATAHTLKAGAAGLVDLSAETSSAGFTLPVIAGCNAPNPGNMCYNSTSGNLQANITGNRLVVGETAAVLNNTVLASAFDTVALAKGTSIIDDAKDITSTEIASLGNRVALTSDFTDSTSTTLQLISNGAGNELKWTLPTSKALNVSFHCNLIYDQATALVSDSFGIGVTGTAPTQANASGVAYITTATFTEGVLTGLASTTPTAVVTFTPGGSVATIYNAELDGTVEQPSNATPGVLGIYVSTTTGTDNIIVKRGSYCALH